jgi:DnaJ-class molecular chaperone
MKKVKCFNCNGRGRFELPKMPSIERILPHLDKCHKCKGKGYIKQQASKRERIDDRGRTKREVAK